MSMNDLLTQARCEIAHLQKQNAALKQQVKLLSQRPEFDLSTVHGREQAVISRLNNKIKPDMMVVSDE
jgi:cell division protein FtsB